MEIRDAGLELHIRSTLYASAPDLLRSLQTVAAHATIALSLTDDHEMPKVWTQNPGQDGRRGNGQHGRQGQGAEQSAEQFCVVDGAWQQQPSSGPVCHEGLTRPTKLIASFLARQVERLTTGMCRCRPLFPFPLSSSIAAVVMTQPPSIASPGHPLRDALLGDVLALSLEHQPEPVASVGGRLEPVTGVGVVVARGGNGQQQRSPGLLQGNICWYVGLKTISDGCKPLVDTGAPPSDSSKEEGQRAQQVD
jgi:hypothetical protein